MTCGPLPAVRMLVSPFIGWLDRPVRAPDRCLYSAGPLTRRWPNADGEGRAQEGGSSGRLLRIPRQRWDGMDPRRPTPRLEDCALAARSSRIAARENLRESPVAHVDDHTGAQRAVA